MRKQALSMLAATLLFGALRSTAGELKKVKNAVPNSYIVVLDDKLLTKPVSEVAQEPQRENPLLISVRNQRFRCEYG